LCRWLQAVFRGEMGDTQAHELCRIANHLHLRVDLEQSNFFALQIICVRRDGIAFCVSIRMHPLLLGWKFHIKAKCSVSTSHPRGNTVDGLPRASKFYWHNSGANSLQKCMRFFGIFLHKILNISRPCGQILMKSCPAGAKTM